MVQDSPSRRQDQFVLRMPDGLRDRIAKAAAANGRSMNAEIIRLLEDHYPPEQELRDLVSWIEEVLDNALNNDWRDSRKYLTEALEELANRIRSESFDPREMKRLSSSFDHISEEAGYEKLPGGFPDESGEEPPIPSSVPRLLPMRRRLDLDDDEDGAGATPEEPEAPDKRTPTRKPKGSS